MTSDPDVDGAPDEDLPVAAFPAVPSSVPAARDWARLELVRHGCDDARVEAAVLLVSELATNAVRHTSTNRFIVCLDPTPDGISIAVHDHDPTDPRPPGAHEPGEEPEEGDDHARGLILVQAVSDTWGVVTTTNGKCVWCTCR